MLLGAPPASCHRPLSVSSMSQIACQANSVKRLKKQGSRPRVGDNRSITGAHGEQPAAGQKPHHGAGEDSALARGHSGLRPCSQRALVNTFAEPGPRRAPCCPPRALLLPHRLPRSPYSLHLLSSPHSPVPACLPSPTHRQLFSLDDEEDLFVAAAVFFCFFVSSSIYLFTRAKSSYAVTSIASRCIPSPVSLYRQSGRV